MARYIDADKVVKHLTERHNALCKEYGETDEYCEGYGDAMLYVESTEAEDVVPRSEVEKYIANMNAYGLTAKRLAEKNEGLKKENEILSASNKTLALSRRGIEAELTKAKQEVAKQIFEEIEKKIEKHYNRHIFGVEELSDVEQEAVMNFSDDVSIDLYELKKKYIGE